MHLHFHLSMGFCGNQASMFYSIFRLERLLKHARQKRRPVTSWRQLERHTRQQITPWVSAISSASKLWTYIVMASSLDINSSFNILERYVTSNSHKKSPSQSVARASNQRSQWLCYGKYGGVVVLGLLGQRRIEIY